MQGKMRFYRGPMLYRSIRKLIHGVPIIGEVKHVGAKPKGNRQPATISYGEGRGALAWSQ